MVSIRYYLALLVMVLAGLVAASVWLSWSSWVDIRIYDQVLRSRQQAAPDQIVLITIDEYSLSQIGSWPWSRAVHAELIRTLTEAGARVIGYDFAFVEPHPFDREGDQALAEAISAHGRVVLPVYIDQLHHSGQLLEVMPSPVFGEKAALGHVNIGLDADGIARRVFLREGIGNPYWPHFSQVVADLALHGEVDPQLYQQPAADATLSPFHYARALPRHIPFIGGVGSFQQVSFFDVAEGLYSPEQFRDKIVLVGASALTLGDLLPTPVTTQGGQMPGIEINANILQALLQDAFIREAAPAAQVLLSIALLIPILLLLPRLNAILTLVVIGLAVGISYAITHVALLGWHRWMPLGSLQAALLISYPGWSVLRLHHTLRYLRSQVNALHQQVARGLPAFQFSRETPKLISGLTHLLHQLDISGYALFLNTGYGWQRSGGSMSLGAEWLPAESLPTGRCQAITPGYAFYYGLGEQRVFLVVPFSSQRGVLREWVFLRRYFQQSAQPGNQLQGSVYDMLIRRLAEVSRHQALIYASNRGLLDALHAMREGVLIADHFGRVLFANRFAERLLDRSLQADDTSALLEWLQPLRLRHAAVIDTAASCAMQRVVRELLMLTRPAQYDVVLPEGTELVLAAMRAGQQRHAGSLLVINLMDVTRIREAQRLHREAIDFLSHDMRAPIASLLALVQQQKVTTAPDNSALLDQIERYAQRSLHFTEQFLQLARVESDAEIQTYLLNVEEVIQNAIDECYHLAQARGVSVSFIPPSESCWVDASGELLERVLINLLNNAIKYGPESGSIRVDLERLSSQQVSVSVSDQGPGVPDAWQARLFAPYQRHVERGTISGAGLGLRFVYVTIRRFGGDVFFENLAPGAKFGFILPTVDL